MGLAQHPIKSGPGARSLTKREDEKFRVLLRDNLDYSKVEGLRKLMVKTRIVSQQSMLIIDTKRNKQTMTWLATIT